MTRTVVYAAPFGNTDPVMPVLESTPDVDYLVLTDRAIRVPRPWRVRLVELPIGLESNRMRNRWCKLHASRLLADYDRSVYVDTHLQVVGDLTELLDDFAASNSPIGLMRHPKSHSVDEEIERSLRYGRITRTDHDANWPAQRARYRAAGFNDDLGVFFAAILLRNHRDPQLAELEDAWWHELTSGVTRDQVALPFAVWRTGVSPHLLPLDWSLDPYLHRWRHLPGRARYGRLVRWFDARVVMRPHYRWALRVLRPRAVFAVLRRQGAGVLLGSRRDGVA